MDNTILVRNYDENDFQEITISEYQEAETKAGSQSAFAETRVVENGEVKDTGMTVMEFLRYRN